MKVVIQLRDRLLKSLLFGRFEPIETTLSASAFVHGAIILIYNFLSSSSLLGVNSGLEVFAGSSLVISGVSVIRSLCKEYSQVRRFSAFGQFLSWTLLALIILSSGQFHYFLHFGYATLALIAAFIYLNLSVGDRND